MGQELIPEISFDDEQKRNNFCPLPMVTDVTKLIIVSNAFDKSVRTAPAYILFIKKYFTFSDGKIACGKLKPFLYPKFLSLILYVYMDMFIQNIKQCLFKSFIVVCIL